MKKYISPNSATWEDLLARPTATYDDLEPLVAEVFEAVKTQWRCKAVTRLHPRNLTG